MSPEVKASPLLPLLTFGFVLLSQLKTTTTAAISRDFREDRLWLNGKEDDIGHPRLQSCLRESECKVGVWWEGQKLTARVT